MRVYSETYARRRLDRMAVGQKISEHLTPIRSLRETGRIMACSAMRVKQIEQMAFFKIRAKLLEDDAMCRLLLEIHGK